MAGVREEEVAEAASSLGVAPRRYFFLQKARPLGGLISLLPACLLEELPFGQAGGDSGSLKMVTWCGLPSLPRKTSLWRNLLI